MHEISKILLKHFQFSVNYIGKPRKNPEIRYIRYDYNDHEKRQNFLNLGPYLLNAWNNGSFHGAGYDRNNLFIYLDATVLTYELRSYGCEQ